MDVGVCTWKSSDYNHGETLDAAAATWSEGPSVSRPFGGRA